MKARLGRTLGVLLVAVGTLGTSGCYTSRFDQVDRGMAEIREELRRLASEEAAAAERLKALEADSAAETEARRLARAEASSRHQEIVERLDNLQAALGDARDRRGSSGLSAMPPPAGPSAADPTIAGPPPPSPDALDGGELRAAYDAARLDLTRGNFELAATSFSEFVRLYPTSELADNAQYWLGEAYYAQNQYVEALAEFSKVVDNYPRGDKVPSALLKMAFSNLALGRKGEGTSLLKRVTSEFPGTPEARQAEDRLRGLASGG